MKTFALAAAFAAATVAPAVAATDTSGFGFQKSFEQKSFIDLSLVRSETGGRVEIVDRSRGALGPVIGTQEVRAGANIDVRVDLVRTPRNDVFAVLYDADNNVVDTRRLRAND